MLFFLKLKQKISKTILTRSQKNYLAVLSLVLMFVFLYPHSALAIDNPVTWAVKLLLQAVLQFCSLLLSMAETIFKWIVNADNMKAVMDNDIVYGTWRTVRDVFNVAFIMVLLFSAFATIFQAPSNFNYKKILLNLVIMALLVNFSYPIARFIIDASNMMMFGFLKNLGGTNSFMKIIEDSHISGIFTATKPDLLYLLSAIVFTFIFAVTLLVIAVLLVIRTIALTIYIIFSPIAFIGPIVPGTAIASAGSDWWKEFMKYCFSGPTMIFMLYIASRMFSAISSQQIQMGTIALTQVPGADVTPALSNLIRDASFFSLPIVILWLGIIQAQKSGIAGAGAVVAMGTKAINKAGKWASGGQFASNAYKSYSSRRAKAKEDDWSAKLGNWAGGKVDQGRGKLWGGRDARLRYENDDASRKKKEAERMDTANMGINDLHNLATSGNKYQSAAAIEELINQNSFDMSDPASAAAYAKMRQEFGETSQVFNQINNKLKAFDPVSAFAHITNATERQARTVEYINSNKFKADNLGANSLGNAAFMETAFKESAITNDDLEKLRKKSAAHERNMLSSLGATANNVGDPGMLENNIAALRTQPQTADRDAQIAQMDRDLRIARSVHTSHFAQTGNFHSSLAEDPSITDQTEIDMRQASRAHIISRLKPDTMKRMQRINTGDPGRDEAQRTEFVENLNSNRFKAIMTNDELDGNVAADLLNTARMMPSTGPGGKNTYKADHDIDLLNIR
jgi:hypothetical protein